MKLLHLFIPILLLFNSCNLNNENKQKELELKERELELKEKELKLIENKKEQEIIKPLNKQNTSISTTEKKELRYLFYANGGMKGYFNDGTIVGCPRCDFCKTNILGMFNEKPEGTYTVESDGSLLINNSEREFPKLDKDNGWALINYKWYEKVPQE